VQALDLEQHPPGLLSQLDESRDHPLAGAEPHKESSALADETRDWSERLTSVS
jgi:hypothetical protein